MCASSLSHKPPALQPELYTATSRDGQKRSQHPNKDVFSSRLNR